MSGTMEIIPHLNSHVYKEMADIQAGVLHDLPLDRRLDFVDASSFDGCGVSSRLGPFKSSEAQSRIRASLKPWGAGAWGACRRHGFLGRKRPSSFSLHSSKMRQDIVRFPSARFLSFIDRFIPFL